MTSTRKLLGNVTNERRASSSQTSLGNLSNWTAFQKIWDKTPDFSEKKL